jgi:hypothetical protein
MGKTTPVRRVSSKKRISVVGSGCHRVEAVWESGGLSARWEITAFFPPSGSSGVDMAHVLIRKGHFLQVFTTR